MLHDGAMAGANPLLHSGSALLLRDWGVTGEEVEGDPPLLIFLAGALRVELKVLRCLCGSRARQRRDIGKVVGEWEVLLHMVRPGWKGKKEGRRPGVLRLGLRPPLAGGSWLRELCAEGPSSAPGEVQS